MNGIRKVATMTLQQGGAVKAREEAEMKYYGFTKE